MSDAYLRPNPWTKLPLFLRAIISGLLIGLVAANVWLLLLLKLGVLAGAIGEAIFLTFYLWWAAGGGPPRTSQTSRAVSFRRGRLSPSQWFWGMSAALFFAITIHASITLLFRLVSFPLTEFRRGYDLSFIPTVPLRWLAVVVAAMSAGICEETGFRGYMQRPIEQRYSVTLAILTSSFFFTVVHLTKGWALIGMVPIVFGAGVLLGLLAWSAKSLIPGMVGHVLMDIGLFAYWWSGLAGDFTARPITETGIDQLFVAACAMFAVSLFVVLLAISKLKREKSRSH
jgi:membrane protease YdiL (CAAX protease family)